jgi:predicted nucleic acid-binding protein
LDTNILVYGLLEPESSKKQTAEMLISAVADKGVLAAQVLAELLAVTRRLNPRLLPAVTDRMTDLISTYRVEPTTEDVLLRASSLVQRYELQVFDSIICAASDFAGAAILLSEDMQDGMRVGGLRILNPFNPDNRAEIEALLA